MNCWKCKMSACADGSLRQSGPCCTQLWARLMLAEGMLENWYQRTPVSQVLPVTLRMARYTQAQQKILQSIKGSIDAVQARYKNSPEKLATELSKLYEKHGVKPIDGANLVGMVA